jgi:hypothetical protein
MEAHPDPDLTDQVLGSEIELLADLIDAASHACSQLNLDQIDAVLGVCRATGQSPSQSPRQ